jgi:uncharacterized membrane protein YdfJ with MMPL/SSD domain
MKQLEEIKARASAATLGPWHVWDDGDVATTWTRSFTRRRTGETHVSEVHIANCSGSDSVFIAAARTDVPKLVAALESVEEVLTWLDEIAASARDDQRIATGSHVQAGGVASIIRNAITDVLEAA